MQLLLTLEGYVLKIFRIFALLFTPLLFLGLWYVAPQVLGAEGLRWLSGLVAILWGLEFYFFQRLSTISAVEGLSSSENSRLLLRLKSIRKRILWIGGIALLCSILLWLMTAMDLPIKSPTYAAMVGALIGINLSYLILIPGWLAESQDFIDDIKRREILAKKRAENVKQMTINKK